MPKFLKTTIIYPKTAVNKDSAPQTSKVTDSTNKQNFQIKIQPDHFSIQQNLIHNHKKDLIRWTLRKIYNRIQ